MTRRRPTVSIPDHALLLRYVSGQATLAEADLVRRWAVADPDREASLVELRAGWEQTAEPEPWDGRELWGRISAEMGEQPVRRRRDWRPYALAASVAIAITGGFLITRSHSTGHGAVAATTTREVTTQRGQRAAFQLADGTRIVVGPESRLRVAIGAVGRDVQLDGEAYFDVAHDSSRPFRVHTRDGIAEDIGTAFLVTAYPETPGTQVAVTHGKVALRAELTEPPLLTLVEGDLGRLDSSGTATLTRATNLAAQRARADGRLVFDGTPLGEAIPMLNRWYNVEIRLADRALAERRVVATFRDEPISQVMRRIALALELTVTERETGSQRVFQFSPSHRRLAPSTLTEEP